MTTSIRGIPSLRPSKDCQVAVACLLWKTEPDIYGMENLVHKCLDALLRPSHSIPLAVIQPTYSLETNGVFSKLNHYSNLTQFFYYVLGVGSKRSLANQI